VVDWEAWRPRWPASSLPFPSEEQRAIASCILSGTSTIVQAVAGAGKTTSMLQTVVLLAREQPASRALILCYNKKLQEGTQARVQRLIDAGHLPQGALSCYTLHALAQSLYGVECKDDNGLRLVCEDNLPLRNCKRFTHVMVDEAQDLTPLLFSVLLKVSIDLAKHAGTGLVFAVFGDPMQTVYAFRASSSGYLTHADALLAPGQRWERLPLRTTNRLTANMTDFLNCVIHQRFSYLVPRKGPGEPVHLYLGSHYDSQGKI
jgi:superfamily I DNA/RNA helicase